MSAKPCKGCGRPVVFAKELGTGKWQVLDNVSPCWEQVGVKDGVAVVVRAKAFVSHFSTCPKADDFSASKRQEPAQDRHFSEPEESS